MAANPRNAKAEEATGARARIGTTNRRIGGPRRCPSATSRSPTRRKRPRDSLPRAWRHREGGGWSTSTLRAGYPEFKERGDDPDSRVRRATGATKATAERWANAGTKAIGERLDFRAPPEKWVTRANPE